MINLLKSSTLLEVTELRPSHGRNSTNSSKEKLIEEDSLFDLAHLLTYASVTYKEDLIHANAFFTIFIACF